MAKKNRGTDKQAVQNAAKTLLSNIRFSSVDRPIQTITVTSSTPNEGKSTVALNLAQAIATGGSSVLLVECDMRRRSMADMIGAHARGGVYTVLSEQMSLEDAVIETSQKNLYFLDSEPHIPNPADLIVSRRFKRLVEEAKSRFRYIVFDTPPVGTFVDAAEVGRLCDGVVFVIRENFTKRNEVMAAFDQLRKAEVNVLGTVMNYCETENSEYYYAYYTKEGKRVRTSDDVQAVEPAPAPAKRSAVGALGGAAVAPARTATPASGVQAPVQGHLQSGSRFTR